MNGRACGEQCASALQDHRKYPKPHGVLLHGCFIRSLSHESKHEARPVSESPLSLISTANELQMRCITVHNVETMADQRSRRPDFADRAGIRCDSAEIAGKCRYTTTRSEAPASERTAHKAPALRNVIAGGWSLQAMCSSAGALEQGKSHYVPEMYLRF